MEGVDSGHRLAVARSSLSVRVNHSVDSSSGLGMRAAAALVWSFGALASVTFRFVKLRPKLVVPLLLRAHNREADPSVEKHCHAGVRSANQSRSIVE